MSVRSTVWFCVLLALGACESKPPASATQTAPDHATRAGQKSARPEVPVRIPAPMPNQAGQLPVSGMLHAFVGALRENRHGDEMQPSDYCLDDGMQYQGARWRLGRINVFGLDAELSALARSQAVIVYGREEAPLLSVLQKVGPCPDEELPVMQMRSDWIADEGGYRTTRARLQELTYIQGQAALAVTLYEVIAADERELRLRVHNPFDAPYSEMSLIAHYEGGPGKPMPHYDSQLVQLAAGGSVEIALPRSADPDAIRPPTKMGWDLHSIQLRGRVGRARMDADLTVPHR